MSIFIFLKVRFQVCSREILHFIRLRIGSPSIFQIIFVILTLSFNLPSDGVFYMLMYYKIKMASYIIISLNRLILFAINKCSIEKFLWEAIGSATTPLYKLKTSFKLWLTNFLLIQVEWVIYW